MTMPAPYAMPDPDSQPPSAGWRRVAETLAIASVIGLALALLVLHQRIGQIVHPKQSILEQVLTRGVLRVATRWAPTTYREHDGVPQGFEYDLMQGFADRLGVRLQVVFPGNLNALIERVAGGQVDLAAAGLTRTPERLRRLDFGPVYQTVTPQLVYHQGDRPPRRLADIRAGELVVVAASSHAELLRQYQVYTPGLHWEERNVESWELLRQVNRGLLRYTVADSNTLDVLAEQLPELRAGIDIGPPGELAWALPKRSDTSLLDQVDGYFLSLKHSGELARIKDRYFDVKRSLDYIDLRTFHYLLRKRLPPLLSYFQEVGQELDLDWRLLAAIAYQESHWNPKARSPTGVRGLMMLTEKTAGDLGVSDRVDVLQSIRGGARYFRRMRAKIPARVREPDRTWLALAAYNIGYGHLEDARVLTQRQGGDPDRWEDVRARLPLLQHKRWHGKTRHGYARGKEAVTYVENIRAYYRILRGMSTSGLLAAIPVDSASIQPSLD